MEIFERLSRAEMKNVLGGNMPVSSCTADCGFGTSVTCTGSPCQAVDYSGCDAAGKNPETQSCNTVIPG